MPGSVRVVFDPVVRRDGPLVVVLGGLLRLSRRGPSQTRAKRGVSKPATLTFHAAYLEHARNATPTFEPFATLSGEVVLDRGTGRPLFKLPSNAELSYSNPDRLSGARLALQFASGSFQNAPKAGPASELRLPTATGVARFLEVGVALEIDGSPEADLTVNDRLDVPLGIGAHIVAAPRCFAPGEVVVGPDGAEGAGERCSVTYSILDPLGQISAGRLEVRRGKTGETLAIVPLEEATLETGTHTVEWDGRCTEGERAGRFVTVLESPYQLCLVTESVLGAKTSIVETEVVLGDLQIRRAPYVDPDAPPAPGSDAHYQLRLTELGYHVGPVDGAIGDKSKRGIKDFQRAHAGLKPTGTLDEFTKAYLDATAPSGSSLSRYQFILNNIGFRCGTIDGLNGKKTRRAVERYRAERGLGPGDTLDDATRAALDAEPIAPPLRREVLEGDLGVDTVVDAPLPAAGSEKKVFIYCDSSISPTGLPYNQKFAAEKKNLVRPHVPLEVRPLVRKSDGTLVFSPDAVGPVRINFKVSTAAPPADHGISDPTARAYVDALLNKDGGTDTTGHHAHASRGGVRRGDDPGVFLKGGGLAPHQVQKAGPVYYAECAQDPGRARGTAGAYFVPSPIAGDRVSVVVDVDGEKFDMPRGIERQTGTFVNVRRYSICKLWAMAYVPRPHRTTTEPELGLRDWFEPGFIEFVEPPAPRRLMIQPRAADPIDIDLPLFTAVCREAGYSAALLSDAQIRSRFDAEVLWPLQPAAVYNAADEQGYYDAIDGEIMAFEERFSVALRELSMLEGPLGVMVLLFHRNAPRAGTLGVHAITNPDLQIWSWSVLASEGSIHLIFNQDAHATAIDGETLAHEMGHALWLHHASTEAGQAPYVLDRAEHDPAAYETCTMSYISLSHFCGKCVLKLRGFDEAKV